MSCAMFCSCVFSAAAFAGFLITADNNESMNSIAIDSMKLNINWFLFKKK